VFICFIGAIVGIGLAFAAATRLTSDFQGPLEEWTITIQTFAWGGIAIASLIGASLLLWHAVLRASLGYELDRNGIYVVQRGSRYTIPLNQVIAISPANQVQQSTKPMIVFGRGQPAQQLVVETYYYIYKLALAERNQFAREVQERRQLGAVQEQPEGQIRAGQSLYDFFAAATIQRFLITTLVLNLLLWALLTWRFPELPATVPVRFDPLGGTAGTRAKTYILLLPAIATGAWIGNLVLAVLQHRRSRLVAELLLLGALIVQIVLLLAVWFLITVAQ
jgi:hypothetical protein